MLAREAPVLCIAIIWAFLAALRLVPGRSESQASGPRLWEYSPAGSGQSSSSRFAPRYEVYTYKPAFEGQESTETDDDTPVYLFAVIKAPHSCAPFGFPQKFNYELFSSSNEESVPTWTGPLLLLHLPWSSAAAPSLPPPSPPTHLSPLLPPGELISFFSTGDFKHMFGYTVVVDKTAEEGVPGACIGRIGQTSEIQFEDANECAVEIELLRSFRAPYLPHPSPPLCPVRYAVQIAEGADPIGMLCLAIVAEQLRPKNPRGGD